MSDSGRKRHWERVYGEKRSDEVSWFQARPERSLELIAASGVACDAPLIDMGGGASTLVDHLLAAGYRDLTVLDISAAALAVARGRLGEAAEGVAWIEADACAFAPPRRYALWHDRAVFHFLTAAGDRAAYLKALRAGLAPGGHLVIAAFAPDGPEKCSGLPVVRYDAAGLAVELGAAFELLCSERESHLTPSGGSQSFGYHLFRHVG